jgi:hypothetical protein
MRRYRAVVPLLLLLVAPACNRPQTNPAWPVELTRFEPHANNPVFTAAPQGSWDADIRERGWIMKDGDLFKLWYTGYDQNLDRPGELSLRRLGYATSPDGIRWERYPDNPIIEDTWVEDVSVVKHDGVFYLFAELEHGGHWFTSPDGINWERQGPFDIRTREGQQISERAGSTPHVLIVDDVWYFYFQNTGGVWAASSTDGPEQWTLLHEGPVIEPGPEPYDSRKIASDQVLRYNGRWYMYYHGASKDGSAHPWSTHLAASDDGIHWTKYPQNPVVHGKHSAFVVDDGAALRLYTVFGQVDLFWPSKTTTQ